MKAVIIAIAKITLKPHGILTSFLFFFWWAMEVKLTWQEKVNEMGRVCYHKRLNNISCYSEYAQMGAETGTKNREDNQVIK